MVHVDIIDTDTCTDMQAMEGGVGNSNFKQLSLL